MVGTEAGADAGTTSVIASNHVGAVILMRSSSQGVAGIASVTTALQAAANGDSIRLFVATDQEGGEVQRMTGPGFSTIPSAIEQGSLDPATLQRSAARWGAQLRAAGVNVDLAPVLDTVPSAAFAPANPPIGALDREFGFDPQIVAAHGSAFAQGLAAAGVSATVKHFPGLGRVTGNTDTTAGVTDTETTRNDPYLTPFTRAIRAGAPFVMMSTAVYSRIDPAGPAAFSSIIVTGLLRNTLGFRGVVISDDVGAAAQVAAVPVAERALRFIAAGGDIVLTVDATQIAEMAAAVIASAQRDPAFRARVDAAALRVLTAKQAHGLL